LEQRRERIGAVIAAVLDQACRDARATGIVLLHDGTPEAALVADLIRPRLAGRLAITAAASPALPDLIAAWAEAAASHPDALVAAAPNKTVALLGGAPATPLLPLADLWASQIAALCGTWSAPGNLRELAERAGGIDRLDDALSDFVDGRLPWDQTLARLGPDLAGTVLALWNDTRFARRRLGLVPKLGARTIGVDLFD
jgi:hypothetical protein